ncbi:MAG: 3,4-dihydroxy-2-butanone-4-phosphate synthase [Rhizobiaceae bacterium]
MTTDMERVADAVRAFESGEVVVVMDDDDRENEGDLIVAAVHCTSEIMGMFIRHTSGIVCAPMTGDEARRLNLAPMVAENDAPHSTAFTVSVDYRHDTTTGISAEERCSTVRALANPNAGANDFVRPGHIFPLVAREGGVLIRSGHTEAAVDLCELAGLPPVGVISELVNDDGSVMRGPQISAFAQDKDLKIVTVADLIAYRQRREKLVDRVEEFGIHTSAGPATAVTYSTEWDPMQQLAVVYGDIRDGRNVLVRLHIESVIEDAFGGSPALHDHMAAIAEEGRGVIVYLREGSVGVTGGGIRGGSDESIRNQPAYGDEAEEHRTARSRKEEWLEIGMGAQILKDLGVTSIRLIASKERHYVGLSGFGIEIADTVLSDG